MPLRSYDPTIARWNRIDPVTYHSLSTYNGFDNNPIYYADPSGGNSFRGGHANRLQRMRDQYYGSEYSNLDSFVGRVNDHSTTFDDNNNRPGVVYQATNYGNDLAAALKDLGVKYDILHTGDLNYNITQKEWDSYDKPWDYFDKNTGEYLGGGGTDEIRFISKEDWKTGNLDNYETFTTNDIAQQNVFYHYLNLYNLAPEGANEICISCSYDADGYYTGYSLEGGKHSIMARLKKDTDIVNRWDAINLIVHEINAHGSDWIKSGKYSNDVFWQWEKRATNMQIRHFS